MAGPIILDHVDLTGLPKFWEDVLDHELPDKLYSVLGVEPRKSGRRPFSNQPKRIVYFHWNKEEALEHMKTFRSEYDPFFVPTEMGVVTLKDLQDYISSARIRGYEFEAQILRKLDGEWVVLKTL